MSDVVTGEAVVLELRLAKLPSRALGFLVDATVQILLLIGFTFALAAAGGVADDALIGALAVTGIAMIFIGLPATVETLSRGRSVGKLLMGLRVVRDDGGPIRFRHALIRALAAFFVDIWLTTGVVGVVTSLASSRGKRVGDYLAGTVVVRERVPGGYGGSAGSSAWAPPAWLPAEGSRPAGSAAPTMPPELAGWAASLDLSQLPGDLALAARQYLYRMGELAPAVREDLGHRLTAEVAARIGQPVPAGMPAWAFLSAVLVERRNRELARLPTGGPGEQPAPTGAPTGNAAGQPASPTQPRPDRQAPQATTPDNGPFAPPS